MATRIDMNSQKVASVDRTPSYVYDETTLVTDTKLVRDALDACGGQLLFAMKSCAFGPVLKRLNGLVAGFHASSLFEAKLARQLLGNEGKVHVTTPSIPPAEAEEICALSDMISCNSLPQLDMLRSYPEGGASLGLRLNPEMSFVADERYDPCRRHSKLGVTFEEIQAVLENDPARLLGLGGLLIHANCESKDFRELCAIVTRLDETLSPLLEQIEWINLGGGYIFRDGVPFDALHEAVSLLRTNYGVAVYMEPGASVVQRSGSLVATVLEVFWSGGKQVAVLDASLNHLPEYYEFQLRPSAAGHGVQSGYRYLLAGATCLAGDVFGDYEFAAPLEPGARVVFEKVGDYSMVKAHMFNGINLPSVYWNPADGPCRLEKHYTYNHFLERCGMESHEDF